MSKIISRDKKYLFNNTEVKLTGRFATKIRIKQRQEVQIPIYEVQPVDEFEGTWKKWAMSEELLEISDMLPESE